LASDRDYVILFENSSGQHKIAAWTVGEPHAVGIELSFGEVKRAAGKNGVGESFTPKIDSGRLALDISGSPQYITLMR
jgi:hypothetical protein